LSSALGGDAFVIVSEGAESLAVVEGRASATTVDDAGAVLQFVQLIEGEEKLVPAKN